MKKLTIIGLTLLASQLVLATPAQASGSASFSLHLGSPYGYGYGAHYNHRYNRHGKRHFRRHGHGAHYYPVRPYIRHTYNHYRPCRSVWRHVYDNDGSRQRVKGTKCYDGSGAGYIVPGSRSRAHQHMNSDDTEDYNN